MGITLKNNKSVTKNMTIKGDDGVGIKTITSGTPVVTEEKTTTPITVTLTDETTQNFNVEAKNGGGADNALTKPTTTPSATQLVAVDNTNSQKMLTIGDGLSIENDTLKASGGSDVLYRHTLRIDYTTSTEKLLIEFSIITRTVEIFTYETLKSYLTNKNTAVNGFKWQKNFNNRIYFISDIFADKNGLQYNSSYVSLNLNEFTFDFDVSQEIPTAVEVYDYVHIVT